MNHYPIAPKPTIAASLPPPRYFCDGPAGSFWTDDPALADTLIAAAFDREEWTVTDTSATR